MWVYKNDKLPKEYYTVLVKTRGGDYITAMYNGECFISIEKWIPITVSMWTYFKFPDGSGIE